MKRVFCFLLALVLLPLFSATAADDDSAFVGVWTCYESSSENNHSLSVYQLSEDQTAFCLYQTYSSNEIVNSSFYFCTWSYADNEIHIKNDNGITLSYYVINDHCFAIDKKGKYDVFLKAQPKEQETPPVKNTETDGVTVPPGLWKIGEDIPAGHWSIRLAADHGYDYVWYFEQPNEFGKPFATLSKYDNQALATEDYNAFGKEYIHSIDYDMKDGWYFYCESSTIFSPYSGKPKLDFD